MTGIFDWLSDWVGSAAGHRFRYGDVGMMLTAERIGGNVLRAEAGDAIAGLMEELEDW